MNTWSAQREFVAPPPALPQPKTAKTPREDAARARGDTDAQQRPSHHRQRLAQPLRAFVAWSVFSVALAVWMDLLVRQYAPALPRWLDLLVWLGTSLPLLLWGGWRFVRQAALQEHALRVQELRSWRKARRDPLTHADNRLALTEHMAQLARTHPDSAATLWVLDLHGFQRINDACGHAAGDEVLKRAAQRLRACMAGLRSGALAHSLARPGAAAPRLVRVGSDEFGLWWPAPLTPREAADTARAVLDVLKAHFSVDGLSLHVRGTVGHVSARLGSLSPSDWLTRADAASVQAKQTGADTCAEFSAAHLDAMVRRHHLQQSLWSDLQHHMGLSLHYQPIVSARGGRVVGCEALVRWQHPRWGRVSPAEFIPVAEGSDLILPLGRWVLDEAIGQLAAWQREGLAPVGPEAGFKVSINISRAQLTDAGLAAFLHRTLRHHSVAPDCVRLEVTESLPLDDAPALAGLQRLRAEGVSLALDDFGSGYSSLSALMKLPIQAVKVDRELIVGIEQCPYRQSLMTSVVHLCALMGLETVAEGVETATQASTLQSLGCQHIQGWLHGSALPAGDFAQTWLPWREKPASPSGCPGGHSPQPENGCTGAATACNPSLCDLPRFAHCPPTPTPRWIH